MECKEGALLDLTLPDEVADTLHRYGVPADRLELEITENIILTDPLRAHAVLAPPERARRQPGDRRLRSRLVRSTIDLGHNLGLRVVAEGVEHEFGDADAR